MIKFLTLALLLTAPLAANAQLADITAVPCKGCTWERYEQTAIGAGLGKRYVYDFANRYLLAFQVTREPTGSGGYTYEAASLPVEPAYQAVFDKAEYVYKQVGTLTRSVVINLGTAPNSGRSDYSVFTLFMGRGDMNKVEFGAWMGNYFSSQKIPAGPDTQACSQEVHDIIMANPTIEFGGDNSRLDVTVEFKDGRAEFVLSKDGKRYNYVPGSATDADNHRIPDSKEGLAGPGAWEFPGGPTGSSAKGFENLARFWGIPIGQGGWKCGMASAGGVSSYTCVMDR